MASNTNIQITELDFSNIKQNFITYLQSQDTFKDYNFSGSALSVLLDILAYNTQYNAYYLNMVANEMFLDSAIQRSSVVSHAKLLNYVPKSAIAPTATINFTVNNVGGATLTLPRFTSFLSESVNSVNYNFVTTDSYTVSTANSAAVFNNVELKQGNPVSYSFLVDSTSNPKYLFTLSDANIDTSTMQVLVQQSSSNTSYTIYQPASDFLTLNSESNVYFLQESLTGYYEIYFGDGVLGNQLSDGNLVLVSFISTSGTASAGANNFVFTGGAATFANTVVTPVLAASNGSNKETIDSIKFQATKSFSAQNRAVTKDDYITAIQQNTLGITFDAVNVWGGELNNPPVYGQVFVCLKPTGAYNLTNSQKQQIITEILKPISVLTVTPNIVDPDYTYIKIVANVFYDPTKTVFTASEIQSGVTASISNFAKTTLNTFNSTFNSYDLLSAIQNFDQSIITSEFNIQLQKKFFPNITAPTTYKLYYNTPLEKGMFSSGIASSPGLMFLNPANTASTIDGVFIEEVPMQTFGVESISVLNPGFNYQSVPTITITGDGTGATAYPVIVNGSIQSVVVTNAGNNYTSAVATVTPAANDTKGQSASLNVVIQGQYGVLRSYYYNSTNTKTIFNSNVGTVDYVNGIITLNSFNPLDVDNALGQLAISVTPKTSIISSTYDGIITVDPFDNSAISVNVTAKKS